MTRAFVGLLLVLVALVISPPVGAAEPPRVIATIKPIHSLVAMVMQGAGQPSLLIGTGASPHTYSLKPSDARALEQADVIVWVGEGLETFLVKPLRTLAKRARVIEVAEAPGVALLPYRGTGAWEAHGHGHGHEHGSTRGHDTHAVADMHIWLDAANAQAIVQAVAAALIEADAGRAELYRANVSQAVARLQTLDDDLRQTLKPLAGRPYVVFHDAYQYLEHRYGLSPVGSITVNPDRQPGAQRVAAIREKIVAGGAVCVFAEPQFEPKLVRTLTDGTKARIGVLDPDGGIGVPAGPDAYPAIMRNMATALRTCLEPSS
jgi:zinc transport system substrate-binding protein